MLVGLHGCATPTPVQKFESQSKGACARTVAQHRAHFHHAIGRMAHVNGLYSMAKPGGTWPGCGDREADLSLHGRSHHPVELAGPAIPDNTSTNALAICRAAASAA